MRRSSRAFSVQSDRGYITAPSATYSSGWVREADGTTGQVSDDAVVAQALRIVSQRLLRGPALLNPQATRDFLRLRFDDLQHEVFSCLYLDNRHRVIAFEELFRGTIDGANVHPREVVKRVMAHNASAVIFAHNHPSGVAEPSHADQLITRRLKDALALIDVRVLDHLVVGGDVVESFAERGLL